SSARRLRHWSGLVLDARLAARGHAVTVLGAERAGRILGQRVAVALAVGRAHERGDDVDAPVVDLARLAPEVGEPEVDVELEQIDAAGSLSHAKTVERPSDGLRFAPMARLRFGPSGASSDDPAEAVEHLPAAGKTAVEA